MGEKEYKSFNIPNKFKLEVFCSLTTDESYKGCILCVPGICHGAWCFENFLKFFPDSGYDCYALSLRGHAGSAGHAELDEYELSDYSDDVKSCIEYCMSENCEYKMKSAPFLLGHSMGGAVVQKYVGKYSNTVRGVILFASATARGMNMLKTLIDTYIHKNLHIAANKAAGKEVTDIELFNAAFFDGRVPMNKIKKYNALLQAESKKITKKDLYKSYTDNYDINLPILVVGSYTDSYFPKKSLEKTATIYAGNGKTALKILDCLCHDMMLDPNWEESAKPILEFIENPLKFVEDQENHWPRKQK